MTALDWYRQSFGSRLNEAESIVALTVALETLLTDQYAPGIAKRLARRVGICMKGVPGVSRYRESVETIYYARSSIVHSGAADQSADIGRAHVAFARCFCKIASLLGNGVPAGGNVMADLLGDTYVEEDGHISA